MYWCTLFSRRSTLIRFVRRQYILTSEEKAVQCTALRYHANTVLRVSKQSYSYGLFFIRTIGTVQCVLSFLKGFVLYTVQCHCIVPCCFGLRHYCPIRRKFIVPFWSVVRRGNKPLSVCLYLLYFYFQVFLSTYTGIYVLHSTLELGILVMFLKVIT